MTPQSLINKAVGFGLSCYCDNCPNNTCTTLGGVCWGQVSLDKNNQVHTRFGCKDVESPFWINLICDNTTAKATQQIVRCCNQTFCNQEDGFLPNGGTLTLNYPLAPQKFISDGLSSLFDQYSNIPQELKLVSIVLSGLLLIFVLAFIQNCFFCRRRSRNNGEEDCSEDSSGRVSSDVAVCDTNSMASREPLINNNSNNNSNNNANNAAPTTYNSNTNKTKIINGKNLCIVVNSNGSPLNQMNQSKSLNGQKVVRGPFIAENNQNSKNPVSFQMSVGTGEIKNKPETSSGSGAGQPYLTQRSLANDIELVEVVGRGYFGVVWRGEYKGEPVAVKIFSSLAEASWQREAEIYSTTLLRHKNILGFIATDKRDEGGMTGYWLVTDYYPMGSLYDFLKKNSVSMPDAVRMAFSIANGLAHLHMEIFGTQAKAAIAHRDVKSKNILVKNDGTCCVADLGMAIRYNSTTGVVDAPTNARVGTRRYLAPEILENKLNLMDFEAVKATDIYALGLVLWEILRRSCLLQNVDPNYQPRPETLREQTVENLNESIETSIDVNSELAMVCDPYEPPYNGYVSTAPTTDEMHEIVCVKKIRPPLSLRWTKFAPMRDYSTLMRECWYEKPPARLSALRIRKTLGDIARHYFNLNMEYD